MANIDHKDLGRVLELFSFNRNVPGTVYWWPKGTILFDLIVSDLKKRLEKEGYKDLKTASIIGLETLKKSGHFDNYREKLFFTGNQKEMTDNKVDWCLKPMNCPGSIMIFNENIHSYKELPIKYSEVGTVFRYEQPGEVNGLLRTRVITQDDAHVYCNENQMEAEILKMINFVYETYKRYGFEDIRVELSTRPSKSIGSDEAWQKAEAGLQKALKNAKIEYKENKGDGAFYGPKIDFHVKDALGRSWQMGTIQLDFATAERLGANYIDSQGQKQPPVIIHRAILGSVERFIAVLLEHTSGNLPVWLAPVQVKILTISEKSTNYAQKILEELQKEGIRVELDDDSATISSKIHKAELTKVPYSAIIGAQEEAGSVISVRSHEKGDQGQMKLTELVQLLSRQRGE